MAKLRHLKGGETKIGAKRANFVHAILDDIQMAKISLSSIRKNPFSQHWLSFPNVSFGKKNIGRMSHFC
jgi:hypothetical protein